MALNPASANALPASSSSDGSHCRCCKRPRAQVTFAEDETIQLQGKAFLINDRCADCKQFHDVFLPMSWHMFCKCYDDDPPFRDMIDQGRKVKDGVAGAVAPAGRLEAYKTIGARMEFVVGLVKPSEVRAGCDNFDQRKLKTTAQGKVLNEKGDEELYYFVADHASCSRRLVLYHDIGHSGDTPLLRDGEAWVPGQVAKQAVHHTNEKWKAMGVDKAFGSIPASFGDLVALADSSGAQQPVSSTITPVTTGALDAAAVQANAMASVARHTSSRQISRKRSDADQQPPQPNSPGPAAVATEEAPAAPAAAQGTATNPLPASFHNMPRGSATTPSLLTPTKQSGAALSTTGSMLSAGSQASPRVGLSKADFKNMTPNEKAVYWLSSIDVMAFLIGKGDHRYTRQAGELCRKFESTQDPSLKDALQSLGRQTELAYAAEKLSPELVVELQDAEYAMFVKMLQDQEVVWPPEVQEGFLKRRMCIFREKKWLELEFLATLLPWSSSSGDSMELMFDPLAPSVKALDVPDARKVELFTDYLAYDFFEVFSLQGKDERRAFRQKVMDFMDFVEQTSDDGDLSLELTQCAFDAMSCLTACATLLETSVDINTFAPGAIDSVDEFVKAGKSKQGISGKVCRLLSSSKSFVAPLIAEYLKHKENLSTLGLAIKDAFVHLVERPMVVGSAAANEKLGQWMDNLVGWQLSMRPGCLDTLGTALRDTIVKHVTQCIGHMQGSIGASAPSGDQPLLPTANDLKQMLAKAMQIWPLADHLVVLSSQVVRCQSTQEATVVGNAVLKEIQRVADAGLVELWKAGTFYDKDDEGTDILDALQSAAKAAREAGITSPGEVAPAVDSYLAALNTKKAWESTASGDAVLTTIDALLGMLDNDDRLVKSRCRDVILTTRDVSHNVRQFMGLGGTLEECSQNDADLKVLAAIGRSKAVAIQCRDRILDPPTDIGTWDLVTTILEEAKTLFNSVADMLVKQQREQLYRSISILRSIASGAKSGMTWHQGVNPRDDEMWNCALKRLELVDLKELETAIEAVERDHAMFDRLVGMFDIDRSTIQTATPIDEAADTLERAAVTKVEGTVAYIHKEFAANADRVALRMKMRKQGKVLKDMQRPGKPSPEARLHPGILTMLEDGSKIRLR